MSHFLVLTEAHAAHSPALSSPRSHVNAIPSPDTWSQQSTTPSPPTPEASPRSCCGNHGSTGMPQCGLHTQFFGPVNQLSPPSLVYPACRCLQARLRLPPRLKENLDLVYAVEHGYALQAPPFHSVDYYDRTERSDLKKVSNTIRQKDKHQDDCEP